MSKSCKCKKPAECEECPEWIFTFADLVMLMMGFFVILWVLKPNAMLGDRSPRIGRKFGNENNAPRTTPPGTDSKPTSIRNGKSAAEGGRLMFESGSAGLSDQTKKELDEIAQVIRGHAYIVLVKGHASLDDLPDASNQDLMALAFKRAEAVRQYLVDHGVAEETLRDYCSSRYEPVRERSYGTNAQSENRRVEVEVTTSLDEDQRDRSAKSVDNQPALKTAAASE